MGLAVHGPAAMHEWERASVQVLTLLGLAERLDYRTANLSGGQKQGVAVARSLVGSPDIVIADEPTAALEKESALGAVTLLRRVGTECGTTTPMVTHDTKIIDLVDRMTTLEDARIVQDTAPMG
jgi:putative ABC transport system ATP-binding protein